MKKAHAVCMGLLHSVWFGVARQVPSSTMWAGIDLKVDVTFFFDELCAPSGGLLSHVDLLVLSMLV